MSNPEQVPTRQRKPLRNVSPPMHKTPLNRFIYILAAISTAFIAMYAYKLITWKGGVGTSWINLATRKPPLATGSSPQGYQRQQTQPNSIEDKIGDLAAALGIPQKDLAAAVAHAIREHVPPTAGSSARKTVETIAQSDAPTQGSASVGTVEDLMDSFVGFDEPV